MPSLKIQQNITLAPFTTFKIGGPAKYFVEVSAEEALSEAINFSKDNNLEVFVLGGGSNVVISDRGFDGLVIKIKDQNADCRITEQNGKFLLECQSGSSLADVVNFCSKNSLTGIEWAGGIPGAFGGAVRGNAGAYGGEMKEIIQNVRIIKVPDAKIKTYSNTDCQFSYRSSIFKKDKNLIIISAVIMLEKGNQEEIVNKVREIIAKRTGKLPSDFSAGSFFQNPIVNNPELIARFERDAQSKSRENKIPAGWLIEEAGMRGKKIGGVAVSEKHANFVINLGHGKAEDIVMLASLIKQQVRNKLGVQLVEEVQYVGF
jgi:UDP-N-acetylmuramate dehydrogenase